MISLQLTMTGAAIPLMNKGVQPATNLSYQTALVQNNGGSVMRFGDSSVSATKGIQIAPTGATNVTTPWVVIPLGLADNDNVYDWYFYGTASDLLDVLLF